MKTLGIATAVTLFAMLFAVASFAGEVINRGEDNLAVKGYDTVAYFTESRPVLGTADYEVEMHGVRWRFSKAGNKQLFLDDPEAYMPRYGGFCSGAMSRGFKATIDPEAFAIIDGRLYLAYTKSGIERFEETADTSVSAADENWKRLGQTN